MFGRTRLNIILIPLLFFGVHCMNALGTTIYVDANAPGIVQDGSSWDTAYTHLADALRNAVAGQTIVIADGTYHPDANQVFPAGTGDPNATFELVSGTTVAGGFAGYGAAEPDMRNTALYPTILSGDLRDNDSVYNDPCQMVNDPCRADNSFRVATADDLDADVVLDGLTITGGHDVFFNSGAGLYCIDSNITLAGCTLTKNYSAYNGGAVCAWYGTTIFDDCIILDNASHDAGGVGCYYANVIINSCSISNNRAVTEVINQGGGLLLQNCDYSITDTTFNNNISNYTGGALFIYFGSGNIDNCSFMNNAASLYGGGILIGNQVGSLISSCSFSNNSAEGGGAVSIRHNSPALAGCDFRANSATQIGGAVYVYDAQPEISYSLFYDNYSESLGGAVYNDGAEPNFYSCKFLGNEANDYGGAVHSENYSYGNYVNTIFSGNKADGGGAVANFTWSSPSFVNCTFSGNTAPAGGAIYDNPGTPSVRNSIVWGNSSQITPVGSAITGYSCIQDYPPGGTGNIFDDPLFVDPNGPDGVAGTEDDDLRLTYDSNCIDAGFNTWNPLQGVTADLDGRIRFIDIPWKTDTGTGTPPLIDMGAYEYWGPLHVDIHGPLDGNGSTWQTAYRNLSDALAVEMDNKEIWIAGGKYMPGPNDTYPIGWLDAGAFYLSGNVIIRGGYAGLIGDDPYYRDPAIHETILTATMTPAIWQCIFGMISEDFCDDFDFNDNGATTAADVVAFLNYYTGPDVPYGAGGEIADLDTDGDVDYDDIYPEFTNDHVIICANDVDTHIVLEALTIADGRAKTVSTPPVLKGAGLVIPPGPCDVTVDIHSCLIRNNIAFGEGGGIYAQRPLNIYDSVFYDNDAQTYGGGIYSGSELLIDRCAFFSNTGEEKGGAIYNSYNAPLISNSVFVGNTADVEAGGIENSHTLYGTNVVNCSFHTNTADSGRDVGCYNGTTALRNCILWHPAPDSSHPQVLVWDSTLDIGSCDYPPGIGMIVVGGSSLVRFSNIINADPCFADANGADGIPGTADDDLHLLPESSCIDMGGNNLLSLMPQDILDVDGDGDVNEPVPFDLDFRSRVMDGNCDGNDVVDIGAYEFSYHFLGDFDNTCSVDFYDYAILADAWLSEEDQSNYNETCDIARPNDKTIGFEDLSILCDNWLAGK